MKKIKNITFIAILLAGLCVTSTSPFGDYTGITLCVNSIILFLLFPAVIWGIIENNPELKDNTLFTK